MLRCVQSSSSSENFSVAGNNDSSCITLSVLERQRAILQRMYQDQQHQSSLDINAMSLNSYQNLINSMNLHHSADENSPNFGFAGSEITSNASLDLDQQHQRSFSTVSATNSSRDHQLGTSAKKRKAEFGEEEECKEKGFEEAGEVQSGLTVKSEKENSRKTSKENSKASSELVQKTDYIHVRARRGQATDSHSLAERARREKISKKMKCLQDLVPGCNKVTGKAGMLDEIINYVQSLQKQVEFLSMKLAALNPRLDFNTEHFVAKEFPAYMASFSPLELMQSAYYQFNNQGPHQQGSGSCSVATSTTPSPTRMVPQRTGTTTPSISLPEAYLDSFSSLQQVQQIPAWDSDWQNLYSVNYHQG